MSCMGFGLALLAMLVGSSSCSLLLDSWDSRRETVERASAVVGCFVLLSIFAGFDGESSRGSCASWTDVNVQVSLIQAKGRKFIELRSDFKRREVMQEYHVSTTSRGLRLPFAESNTMKDVEYHVKDWSVERRW